MPQGGEPLSADDAAILRLESAAVKGHTCKLVVVEPGPDGALDLERLRARVLRGAETVPRARQRVVMPGRDEEPRWEDDPGFDVAAHVVRREVDGPIDRERLREVAGQVMSERLDHDRPLWRLDLVGPLEDGGTAIAMRVHHAMADGIAALRFARAVLWDAEEEGLRPPVPGAATAGTPHGARMLARLPGALARELGEVTGDSPLDRPIGPRRELAFARCPLEDLKRVEHAAGERLGRRVTVNDVFLAAVAGGLREWMASDGEGTRRLRVQVPVSMHHRSERPDELGNHDSFLYVDLPLDEEDPLRRLERINAETTRRKLRGDADELYAFFHSLSHLGPLGRAGARLASSPHEFSLAVSNVPGPRGAVSVLGHRVSELYSVAEPADRHALRITAVSCAGEMGFGLCADPDAISDVGSLATAIEGALTELVELSGAS